MLQSQQDDSARTPDDQLLLRASSLGRVLVTHDKRFRAMAEGWQREGRSFMGLVFCERVDAHGRLIADLELIAMAIEPDEWVARVERIPYRA